MKPLLITLFTTTLLCSLSACSNPDQVESPQIDVEGMVETQSTADAPLKNDELKPESITESVNSNAPPSDQDLADANALLEELLTQDQGISTSPKTQTNAPDNQQIPDFESTKQLAEMGDYMAEFNLGLMYKNGDGVDQDYDKSFEWFMRVANKGIPEAQTNIGLMYKDGQGTEQSYAKAVEWFQKAAIQDYPLAQYNLGVMNMVGEGVAQNDAEAAEWFRKSCDNGYQEGCSLYQEIIEIHTGE